MRLFILWAMPADSDDRLDEQPMTSTPITREQAERVIAAASADGWHGFRLMEDDNAPPDFAAAIRI